MWLEAESNEEAMGEVRKGEAEPSSKVFDKNYELTRASVWNNLRTWDSAEHPRRDPAGGIKPINFGLLDFGSVPSSTLRSGTSFLWIPLCLLPFMVTSFVVAKIISVARIVAKAEISGGQRTNASISVRKVEFI